MQGKRVRARNRLSLLETHSHRRYRLWQNNYEGNAVNSNIRLTIRDNISFLLNICDNNTQRDLDHTIDSLNTQSYTNWNLYTHAHEGGPNGDTLSDFDFLIWVRQGDILPAHALEKLAYAIQANPGVDIFYSDHDYLSSEGRREFPYFKGDWNYGLLLSSDYIFGLCAIKIQVLSPLVSQFNVLSWVGRYQSLVALGLNKEVKSLHVSDILYHCYKPSSGHPDFKLLQAHESGQELFLKPSTVKKKKAITTAPLNLIILPEPKAEPKITLIIPTKDKRDFLEPCIKSILQKTIYHNFDIIIVNNNSQQPETLQYFKSISLDKRVKVLDYTKKFNYAAINNFAVELADGDYICLLNNDTEIIEPGWLQYMICWATRQNVGAVGAKLLYADNRIQHAGVIIGLGGLAGHGHRYLKNNDPGYFYRAHLPQYVSAVTAACLLVEKKKYLEVGGMDSDNFTVAFNDVDFCLKLDAAGYDNVYEPRAVLYHYESRSRGKDVKGAKRKRYLRECEMLQKRWSTSNVVDRYYSPHLATDREDFAIRITAGSTGNP